MIRICTERKLEVQGATRAIGAGSKRYWRPGQVITVSFMDGEPAWHDYVRRMVETHWLRWINVRFEWMPPEYATAIRISFNPHMGSWSYVGLDCLYVPAESPTMNFGWLHSSLEAGDEAEARYLVLHEFGHTLGLQHEQNHPLNEIPWNLEKIRQFYIENGLMNMEQFQFTYIDKWPMTQPRLPFDDKSIMLYPIEPDMLADVDVEWARPKFYDLSPLDIEWGWRTYPPNVPG